MPSPIQIVLNTENYQEAREAGGGGSRKDFFQDRDKEFAGHQKALVDQIDAISGVLSNQSQGRLGYLKLVLRREAWAKSHRPVTALFRPDRTPLVGGADLGVMIVEAHPASLTTIAAEIKKAEPESRTRFDESKKKLVPAPSARRSEVGAIERIELYGPSDKRSFSVDEAIAWLSNPLTGSSYQVQLFDIPAPRSEWDRVDPEHRRLTESFMQGLSELGTGLSVERVNSRINAPTLAMRLDSSSKAPLLLLHQGTERGRRRLLAPFDTDVKHHARLLAFLENHPLVRRIDLPGIAVRAATSTGRTRPTQTNVPRRESGRAYPKLGIVDGGIGPALADWVVHRWDVLSAEDADLDHGTFIGGLATLGRTLNGEECCPEADGMELVDLAIFPDQNKAGAFTSYYPDGLPHFYDELEAAVADARARHGVRVFNMSLNVIQPVAADRYSQHAARLDGIAEANNAVFFVSAGNLDSGNMRPEWPANAVAALATLATTQNDGIRMPAESARNVSVAAVNPPGHDGCIPFAPTRFSRRGPGLRAGVKPDLAHVGGAGTPHSSLGHGLFSITPDGTIVDGCGTSYASPLVAKIAATLEHAIEGEVSRETLIALLIHHAELPEPLREKALSSVVRHMVGFGVPLPAQQILESGDDSISLVFASRVPKDRQISFGFPWPASLVSAEGRCRGRAKLTLVSTPPLDPRFGAEFVRVNINASLQQEQEDHKWKGRLDSIYLPSKRDGHPIEAELIEHDLKWSPVKVLAKTFPIGVGSSSNWRLFVEYLTRAGEAMPAAGVPFTAIMTISDPKGDAPVFNDMRQSLQAQGAVVTDIRTANRITPRV
jgi:hypothetical protein